MLPTCCLSKITSVLYSFSSNQSVESSANRLYCLPAPPQSSMNFLNEAAAVVQRVGSTLPNPATLLGSEPPGAVVALNAGLAAINCKCAFNMSAAPRVALPASAWPLLYLTARNLLLSMVSSVLVKKLSVCAYVLLGTNKLAVS